MKYQCTCGKSFIYPAKKAMTLPEEYAPVFETHVCPYCHSLDFDEIPAELNEKRMVSMKDVPVEEVDKHLADGYVVKDSYAKSVRMVKYAEAKA
jgi:hypothetical protein